MLLPSQSMPTSTIYSTRLLNPRVLALDSTCYSVRHVWRRRLQGSIMASSRLASTQPVLYLSCKTLSLSPLYRQRSLVLASSAWRRIMISSSLNQLAVYFLKRFRRPILLLANVFSRGLWSSQVSNSEISQKPVRDRNFLDKIPTDSWDSHMHVVDPINYPLAQDAQYIPHTHDLFDALKFETKVGIRNFVLIQPSIYGNDNTCMLDALRKLGPRRGRAVVAFDPTTITASTLSEWHALGVRGVRVNLQSVGRQMDPDELSRTLKQYAEIIKPFGWVLQLYVPLVTTVVLEKIVPKLGVTVCLDHFGQPELSGSSLSVSEDPYLIPGFKSLIRLLEQGNTFIKMSAPYRIRGEENSLETMAKEILRIAGTKRVVFATDWPHTRYEGLDIQPFMQRLTDWCNGDEALIERVFKSNAQHLWRVEE